MTGRSAIVAGSGAQAAAITARLSADGFAVRGTPEGDPVSAVVYCPGVAAGADWESRVDRPLRDAFLFAQSCAAHLAGEASYVFIGSAPPLQGEVPDTAAAAADAGVIGLTRALAIDLGPRGVRVNAVVPGRDVTAERVSEIPLRRTATAADVAAVVAFLCSPDAALITGQCINVDGGRGLNRQAL